MGAGLCPCGIQIVFFPLLGRFYYVVLALDTSLARVVKLVPERWMRRPRPPLTHQLLVRRGGLAFRITALCSRGTRCKELLPRGTLTLASALSLCALRKPPTLAQTCTPEATVIVAVMHRVTLLAAQ